MVDVNIDNDNDPADDECVPPDGFYSADELVEDEGEA